MSKTQQSTNLVVVYRIKPDRIEQYVSYALNNFRKLVSAYPGFLGYQCLQSDIETNLFIDIASWVSEEDAGRAMSEVEKIQYQPKFRDYKDAIIEEILVGNFRAIP